MRTTPGLLTSALALSSAWVGGCDDGVDYGFRDTVGLQCGSIGDVDGDGKEDLALVLRFDPATGADASRLLILSGPALEPLVLIEWPDESEEAGRVVEFASRGIAGGFSLGDLNGDGRADFALKERFLRRVNPDVGRTRVVAGGDWRVLHEDGPSKAPESLVRFLQDVGDLDGDGTSDHAQVLEPEYYDGLIDDELEPLHDTVVSVRSGRSFDVLLTAGPGEPWADFGADVARTADSDADGTADLVLYDGSQVRVVSGRDGSEIGHFAAPRDTYSFGATLESLSTGAAADPAIVLIAGGHGGPVWSTHVYAMPAFEPRHVVSGLCSDLGDVDGDLRSDWIAWTRDPRDFVEHLEVRSGPESSTIWRRTLDWNTDDRPAELPWIPDAWLSSEFEFQGIPDIDGDGLRDVAVARRGSFDFKKEGEVFLLRGSTGATLRHLSLEAFAAWESRCGRRVRL